MSSYRFLCGTVLTAAVALSLAPSAHAGKKDRMSDDLLAQANTYPKSKTKKRVIVQFNSPLSRLNPKQIAKLFGGTGGAPLKLVNGAVMNIPYGQLKKLAKTGSVAWVSPDRQAGTQWDYDVQTIGADQVWNATPSYTGTGVRVAVLDTGVYKNDDYKTLTGGIQRLVHWKDLVNNQTAPYDDNGHGTHVAGIAVGSGKLTSGSIGIRFDGVAPNADLVAIKVLGKDGSGSVSTVIAGIDYCVTNRVALNIRVMNLSLGLYPKESYTTDPLCAAVRRAVQAGIVVVCSAGNRGKDSLGVTKYGGISCPANEPSVITVGAQNTFETISRLDDGVCTYSSRGPTFIDNLVKPDLVAPGNKIVSDRSPNSYLDLNNPANRVSADGDYFLLSGTSMAAPQVAGTVALILQANPSLAPNTVKGILMYTAQKLDLKDSLGLPLSPGLSRLTQGAGSVNAPGAVELATKIDTTKPIGAAWLKSALSNQNTVGGVAFN